MPDAAAPVPFRADKKIAYLLKMFPRFSETFILNEILELERQGVQLHIFSLKAPNEATVQSKVNSVRAAVEYVPNPSYGWSAAPAGNFTALRVTAYRNARLFCRDPLRYLRAARACLTHRRFKLLKRFFAAGYIADRLCEGNFEHIHAHFANDPATVALYVHRLTGLPFSFTAHAKDIYTSAPDDLRAKIGAAEFVITCTKTNQEHLSGLAACAASIHTIRHGIEWNHTKRFGANKALSVPQDAGHPKAAARPMILSIGRLVEKKGFEYLVSACHILAQQGVDFLCQIIGEGPLKSRLEQQIRALQLEQHVQLLAFVPHERLADYYLQADVFALACQVTDDGDRDGLPNVLIEAMAHGIPVVSTPISGITELIESDENGLLVPARDPVALAEGLKPILQNPRAYRAWTERGIEKVRAEFSLSANVSRLIAILGTNVWAPGHHGR